MKKDTSTQEVSFLRFTIIRKNRILIKTVGTPEGTRTPNPRNRNPMLYPLSHRCICA